MQDVLLDRLEVTVDKILQQNRCLEQECRLLKKEKIAWQQEKVMLLGEVEQVLTRLDSLKLEDT